MNFGAEHKLNARQVTRTEVELLAKLAAALDQQRRLTGLKLIERFAIQLRLRLGHLKRIDDGKLAIRNLGGNGRAKRAHQLLLRKGIVVTARLRSVDRTATTPERSADRADAS